MIVVYVLLKLSISNVYNEYSEAEKKYKKNRSIFVDLLNPLDANTRRKRIKRDSTKLAITEPFYLMIYVRTNANILCLLGFYWLAEVFDQLKCA